jgi:protein AroM
MRPKIGLLTIGQAPRKDVLSDIRPILGPEIEIIERGALDGLSLEEIEALNPGKNDFPLITRLKDGTTAIVGKRKILFLIQKQISSLERENTRLTALLCTDDFPEIRSQKLLLSPYRILLNTVTSIMKKGRLAVLAPLEEQNESLKKKWQKTGLEIIIENLNPYQESSESDRIIEGIKENQVSLVVLDCIGYSIKLKEKINRATEKPVLLPRSILAGWIKELI